MFVFSKFWNPPNCAWFLPLQTLKFRLVKSTGTIPLGEQAWSCLRTSSSLVQVQCCTCSLFAVFNNDDRTNNNDGVDFDHVIKSHTVSARSYRLRIDFIKDTKVSLDGTLRIKPIFGMQSLDLGPNWQPLTGAGSDPCWRSAPFLCWESWETRLVSLFLSGE